MKIEQLLADIKEVENQISVLDCLVKELVSKKEGSRPVSISQRGSWSVHFEYSEVKDMLDRRHDGLHVKLGRLQEAKKAAEITMEGWLNQSRGGNEQK